MSCSLQVVSREGVEVTTPRKLSRADVPLLPMGADLLERLTLLVMGITHSHAWLGYDRVLGIHRPQVSVLWLLMMIEYVMPLIIGSVGNGVNVPTCISSSN